MSYYRGNESSPNSPNQFKLNSALLSCCWWWWWTTEDCELLLRQVFGYHFRDHRIWLRHTIIIVLDQINGWINVTYILHYCDWEFRDSFWWSNRSTVVMSVRRCWRKVTGQTWRSLSGYLVSRKRVPLTLINIVTIYLRLGLFSTFE